MEDGEHFGRVRGALRARCKVQRSRKTLCRLASRGSRGRVGLFAAFAAAGFFLSPPPARAANAFGIDELKLGVLAHSVGGHESGADLNGELLFLSPVPTDIFPGLPLRPLLLPALTPRPDIGFEANTAGQTSQVYFGLTWTWVLIRDLFRPGDGIDAGIGFGPAFNNGEIRSPTPERNSLGSNVLFHVSGEIGYRISPRYEVSFYFDHVSNAGFATENEGQNDAGARFGINF